MDSLTQVLMRLMDLLLAFPIGLEYFGHSRLRPGECIKLNRISSIRVYARLLIYGLTLRAQQMIYVDSAVIIGARALSNIFKHILTKHPVTNYGHSYNGARVGKPREAALSFLEMGVQLQTPDLGSILNSGTQRN